VPDRPSGQVATDGHAQQDGTGERAVRPPPDGRRLRLDLLHGSPDVIEELDLRDRLQAPQGLADGSANNVRFGERSVVTPSQAELPLEAVGRPEHPALAFDVGQHLLTGIGNVLTKDPDAFVGGHLFLQSAANGVAERDDLALAVVLVLRLCRHDRRDVDVFGDGGWVGPPAGQGLLRRVGDDLMGLVS